MCSRACPRVQVGPVQVKGQAVQEQLGGRGRQIGGRLAGGQGGRQVSIRLLLLPLVRQDEVLDRAPPQVC